MPIPTVRTVKIPFYHNSSVFSASAAAGEAAHEEAGPMNDLQGEGGEKDVLVTNIYIELVQFDKYFFWLHISEGKGDKRPVSPFGSCTMSIPSSLNSLSVPSSSSSFLSSSAVSVSTTQLLELDAPQQSDASTGDGTGQAAFAASLSSRLVRRLHRDCNDAAVALYVNCAIVGERTQFLLGTDGGSGVTGGATTEFSGVVFRECLRVVKEALEVI